MILRELLTKTLANVAISINISDETEYFIKDCKQNSFDEIIDILDNEISFFYPTDSFVLRVVMK